MLGKEYSVLWRACKPFRTDRMPRDFALLNGFTDATISSVTIFGRGTDDIEHWTCGWVRGLIPP